VFVLLARHTIWARWYGYKLQTTTDVGERLECLGRLLRLGDASVPVGAKLTRNKDVGLRSFGVVLLTALRSEKAKPYLLTAAEDPDPDIRRSALAGYAAQAGSDVTAELIRRMDDARVDVAMQATAELARNRPEEAVTPLIRAVRGHGEIGVRIQAIQSLAMLEAGEAIDVLIDALPDLSTYSGRTAIQASAERAFQSAGENGDGAGGSASIGQPVKPVHVVGEEAAQALRAITGQSFDYRADDEPARESAIAAWREWRASQQATQPPT
jgi:HEAT repeat protein